MSRISIVVTVLSLVATTGAACAAPLELSSGVQRVALLELYTSEGCSSCPPADRWLSGLKNNPGLWRHFVPVAFHVDYWDYIGWQDPFARTSHSDRQRDYAREGGARVVYTPGFFIDGQEWRGWRDGELPEAGQAEAGELRLHIENDTAEVRFDAGARHNDRLTVHVVVLGMNLETHVKAGENRGLRLHHDFVALASASASMVKGASGYRASVPLPRPAEARFARHAIVAWVALASAQAPLQSVGGYLPDET